MFKQELIPKLVRFAVVGGLVAGLHSLLIWYFHARVGLNARASFWAGYFPAVTLHFCLTKWWTFRCKRKDLHQQLFAYAIATAISAGVQYTLYYLSLAMLTANPNIAYLFAAVGGMMLSFVLMRWGVFGSKAETPLPAR